MNQKGAAPIAILAAVMVVITGAFTTLRDRVVGTPAPIAIYTPMQDTFVATPRPSQATIKTQPSSPNPDDSKPTLSNNIHTFDDTFASDKLDTSKWTVNCDGGSVSLEKGNLVFMAPKLDPYPEPDLVCQVRYNRPFAGDFDTWVSFSNFKYASSFACSWTDPVCQTINGTPLNIAAKIYFSDRLDSTGYFDTSKYAYVQRQNYPNHEYQADASTSGPQGLYWPAESNDSDGRLRIQRVGNVYSFYYDEKGSWKKIVSIVRPLFKGYISIGLRTESTHPEAKIYLSKFHAEGI